MTVRKRTPSEAEHAAEWILRHSFGCRAVRRVIRTRYAKVDFFGADLVGTTDTGRKIYVQVTTGKRQAVHVRRKKLEGYRWHRSERIFLWQLVPCDNPGWHFRVWEYLRSPGTHHDRQWREWGCMLPVTEKVWWTAYKPEKDPALQEAA